MRTKGEGTLFARAVTILGSASRDFRFELPGLTSNTSCGKQTPYQGYHLTTKYNTPSSNADSIIRVKINENNYLPNAENSIVRGLPNTLK
jgi:hypothetical protein